MEIEIIEEDDNPMLHRTDVRFEVRHEEATPSRLSVRDSLAAQMNKDADEVVVRALDTKFGMRKTVGYAKVYEGPENAKAVEQDHMLQRNKIVADGEGGTQAEAAEADTESPEEPEVDQSDADPEADEDAEEPEVDEDESEAEEADEDVDEDADEEEEADEDVDEEEEAEAEEEEDAEDEENEAEDDDETDEADEDDDEAEEAEAANDEQAEDDEE